MTEKNAACNDKKKKIAITGGSCSHWQERGSSLLW